MTCSRASGPGRAAKGGRAVPWRLVSVACVAEPDRGFGRGAQSMVEAGVGDALKAVLGVRHGGSAEAFLEAGKPARGAGFAKVVDLAAVCAGKLDGVPLQQFSGAGRAGEGPVDRGARVVGGGAEQGDVGGDGPVAYIGDQYH